MSSTTPADDILVTEQIMDDVSFRRTPIQLNKNQTIPTVIEQTNNRKIKTKKLRENDKIQIEMNQ